jgi:hypothetical protein
MFNVYNSYKNNYGKKIRLLIKFVVKARSNKKFSCCNSVINNL